MSRHHSDTVGEEHRSISVRPCVVNAGHVVVASIAFSPAAARSLAHTIFATASAAEAAVLVRTWEQELEAASTTALAAISHFLTPMPPFGAAKTAWLAKSIALTQVAGVAADALDAAMAAAKATAAKPADLLACCGHCLPDGACPEALTGHTVICTGPTL